MTTHPSGYTIGDRVYFGRGQGQQTLGEVVKTHGGRNGTGKPLKKLKVKQLESRGTQRNYPVGTVWGVPASLLTRADGSSSVPAPAPCAYKVGDRVVVKGWADKEVEATVTKPGTGNRCEVYDGGWFPPHLRGGPEGLRAVEWFPHRRHRPGRVHPRQPRGALG